MLKQRVGLHVSAAGGVANAPDRAKEYGAECFQFFSRSPRGGPAPGITKEVEKMFKEKSRKYEMESYVHTPYYINFASLNKAIAKNTVRVVREELTRASQLGVKYVMTHLGSAREWPGVSGEQTPNGALKQTIDGIKAVFKDSPKFSTQLLLEISAGAGAIIGDSFEELAYIIKELGKRQVFVCLDTAHMFASGYDIRTADEVGKTMKEFRRHLGIKMLKLVHINDSKAGLGEHKDQHEHIGRGKVGADGFKALLAHKDLQNVNFILETKHDKHIKKDLELLKKWRKVK
jgi:deoxyribonuclease-4